MTWTEPVTRNTGDLITASIWNSDLVDNLMYLHGRTVTQWLEPDANVSSLGGYVLGAFAGLVLQTGEWTRFTWALPTDFAELTGLDVVALSTATLTAQYDLDSNYAAPGEPYNTHAETVANSQMVLPQHTLTRLDARAVFSSVAAGDLCALKITNDGPADLRVIGAALQYRRD